MRGYIEKEIADDAFFNSTDRVDYCRAADSGGPQIVELYRRRLSDSHRDPQFDALLAACPIGGNRVGSSANPDELEKVRFPTDS
jgi:hypothetical protein